MSDRDMHIKQLEEKLNHVVRGTGRTAVWVSVLDLAIIVNLLKESQEQKHGHWKTVSDYYDDEHWQCSACGCEWYLEAGSPEENNMRFCPECGSQMFEEEEKDV